MRSSRLTPSVRNHRFTFETLESRTLLAADLLTGAATCNDSADSPLAMSTSHDGDQDPLLRHDDHGNPYFFDPAPELTPTGDDLGGFDPREVDIPLLHSNPNAIRKIFLDFDGHIVVGTNWNEYNNNLPIHAAPYSTNADINTFTQVEINNIIQVFNRVAEDFAPFDVDVTLEDPTIADPTVFTVGGRGIRALVSTDVDDVSMGGTGNQWFSGAGGVAYLNSWNWTSDTPVWIFENNLGNGNAKNVAEAASHEVGHALNLSHDGVTGGSSYYGGHGAGETGWAPIMGVGYNRNLTQWSRGEYPNANQTQNDLNIMTARIPYRTDDHSNNKTNAGTATPLTVNGTAVSGSGIIERTTDVDVFTFELTGPSIVDLTVNPYVIGPNLDILAELYDSSGALVFSGNLANELSAFIDMALPVGVYTLALDGVGNGNLTTGYSDYGSLGQFSIEGSITFEDPNPGGPIVSATPTLDNPANPSQVTITFSEPILESSFALFQDIHYFGPGNIDFTQFMTGGTFSNGGLTLSINVPPVGLIGSYRMEIGPQITDLNGNNMDQDQDGTFGEVPDDQYIFQFALTGLTGDFNFDGSVDAGDIDLLCAEVVAGTNAVLFDLTSDGLVNQLDMDAMIRVVLSTEYGDANLDGVVDGSDFNLWNAHRFQAGGWAFGNFNCDELVDGSDFGVWNANKFTGQATRPPAGFNQRREFLAATEAPLAATTNLAAPAGSWSMFEQAAALRKTLPTALRRIDQVATADKIGQTLDKDIEDRFDHLWAQAGLGSGDFA